MFRAGRHDLGGLGAVEGDADEQAAAAGGGAGLREGLHELGAEAAGARHERVALQDVEHRVAGGAGDGVAAERGAVGAGREQRGAPGVDEGGADGQAAAQSLGERDDVGGEAVVLEAVEPAGAPDAGLDLVGDEDGVVLLAELAQGRGRAGVEGHDAALALHGLEEHAGDLLRGEHALQGGGVVEGHVHDLGRQGVEALLVVLLAGELHGPRGAAVERVLEGDDDGARHALGVGVAAHELQGPLVGLGA